MRTGGAHECICDSTARRFKVHLHGWSDTLDVIAPTRSAAKFAVFRQMREAGYSNKFHDWIVQESPRVRAVAWTEKYEWSIAA